MLFMMRRLGANGMRRGRGEEMGDGREGEKRVGAVGGKKGRTGVYCVLRLAWVEAFCPFCTDYGMAVQSYKSMASGDVCGPLRRVLEDYKI